MDLSFSTEERAFEQEVRDFIAQNLTPMLPLHWWGSPRRRFAAWIKIQLRGALTYGQQGPLLWIPACAGMSGIVRVAVPKSA